MVGFAIFLGLLLLAAQVTIRLYYVSALTSAAEGAAEQVASEPAPSPQQLAAAEQAARRRLGAFGASHTTFTWEEVDARQVVLQVRAQAPSPLPLPRRYSTILRTVTVRTERFR